MSSVESPHPELSSMRDLEKFSIAKVISGGQTGVDQAALRAARLHSIPTGGLMPKNCMTEDGPNRSIANIFRLKESPAEAYLVRTIQNVQDADMTLLIGMMSGGTRTTAELCLRFKRAALFIPRQDLYREPPLTLATYRIRREAFRKDRAIVLNVAGTRESKDPGIGTAAEEFLHQLFGILDGTRPKH